MSNDAIVFKCEASLWDMMAEEGVTGIPAKPFDMRRYDMADDRIYRLSWGKGTVVFAVISYAPPDGDGRVQREPRQTGQRVTVWEPEVESITFENKDTGEKLTRRYLGMQFENWAPGWCFLLLGARLDAGGARVVDGE
jgi:hypothetical protein